MPGFLLFEWSSIVKQTLPLQPFALPWSLNSRGPWRMLTPLNVFYFARTLHPDAWLLFAIFVSSKSFPPVQKLLSSMCLFMELTGIDDRFSLLRTSQDLLNYSKWSRSIPRWRLRLICHVAWALLSWLFSTDLLMKRREKLLWTVRASRAILVMEVIRDFLSSGQHFIFWLFSQLMPARNPPKFPPLTWGTAYNHP